MSKLRGVKITGTVLSRDETAIEEVFFDLATLRNVTEITADCFGMSRGEYSKAIFCDDRPEMAVFAEHHDATPHTTLDLSMLEKCTKIGAWFAVGHHGPVLLPPVLEEVGDHFLTGAKVRDLDLPSTLSVIGAESFTFTSATTVRLTACLGLRSLPEECFSSARISAIELPGTIETIADDFCRTAIVGSVQFAPRPHDQQEQGLEKQNGKHNEKQGEIRQDANRQGQQSTPPPVLSVGRKFFLRATAEAVDLPSHVASKPTLAVDYGRTDNSPLFEAATISLVRRVGSNAPLDSTVKISKSSKIGAVSLWHSRDAALFSQNKETILRWIDPPMTNGNAGVSAPPPPSSFADDVSLDVDGGEPAALGPPSVSEVAAIDVTDIECFEPKHEAVLFAQASKLMSHATPSSSQPTKIDMSSLVKCRAFSDGCFNKLTGVTSFIFPPALETIGSHFLSHSSCPALELTFPKSVTSIGKDALSDCELRSVDFRNCRLISAVDARFLYGARSIQVMLFPPQLTSIGEEFLSDAVCPNLDLQFPETVTGVGQYFFKSCTLRSADFGHCASLTEFRHCCFFRCSVASVVLPPALTVVGDAFMLGINCPHADLVFPKAFTTLGGAVLGGGCKIRSIDFSQCPIVEFYEGFLRGASGLGQVSLPATLTKVGQQCFADMRCPTLKLNFPKSFTTLSQNVLARSRIASADFSVCDNATVLSEGFLCEATVSEKLSLPPAYTELQNRCLSRFVCPSFVFEMAETISIIGNGVLSKSKVATVTVSARCTKLATIGDDFLAGASFGGVAPSLSFSPSLRTIGKRFCADTTVQPFDLSNTSLIALPSEFLRNTTVLIGGGASGAADVVLEPSAPHRGVRSPAPDGDEERSIGQDFLLPSSIKTIGDHCFASANGVRSIAIKSDANTSSISTLSTALTVGDMFGADSTLSEIRFPTYRVTVGNGFCKGVSSMTILEARGFCSAGDDFCAEISKLKMQFSRVVFCRIGARFLQNTAFDEATDHVDMSCGTFTVCPEKFMSGARFTTASNGHVTLPATVSIIESGCCSHMKHMSHFSISKEAGTAPDPQKVRENEHDVSIKDDFLRACPSLKMIDLPDRITSFGDRCFAGSPAIELDLSLRNTTKIGDDFLTQSSSNSQLQLRDGAVHKRPRPSVLKLSQDNVQTDTGPPTFQESSASNNGLTRNDSSIALREENDLGSPGPEEDSVVPKVSLRSMRPNVTIGDNFLAHAHCTLLTFANEFACRPSSRGADGAILNGDAASFLEQRAVEEHPGLRFHPTFRKLSSEIAAARAVGTIGAVSLSAAVDQLQDLLSFIDKMKFESATFRAVLQEMNEIARATQNASADDYDDDVTAYLRAVPDEGATTGVDIPKNTKPNPFLLNSRYRALAGELQSLQQQADNGESSDSVTWKKAQLDRHTAHIQGSFSDVQAYLAGMSIATIVQNKAAVRRQLSTMLYQQGKQQRGVSLVKELTEAENDVFFKRVAMSPLCQLDTQLSDWIRQLPATSPPPPPRSASGGLEAHTTQTSLLSMKNRVLDRWRLLQDIVSGSDEVNKLVEEYRELLTRCAASLTIPNVPLSSPTTYLPADIDALLADKKSRFTQLIERYTQTSNKTAASTFEKRGRSSIGHNFLAGTTGLLELDMSSAVHAAIGDRFAAGSALRELELPPTVSQIGKDLCAGCLTTVIAVPGGDNKADCYLSTVMKIRVKKERIDTLIRLRELLATSQHSDLAQWLLEEKCFAEFKGVFNVREDAVDLQHVGGTVDDLPEVPSDVPRWPDFELKVAPTDSRLSLLHWAVKHSRQLPHLLHDASWTLKDMTLLTTQGFTALHYAVLYDIEASALKKLLDIAAKAEIHRTWSEAWSTGGVRVSPLHLAYLYRRDAIVKELLAFRWDPTETIKELVKPDQENSSTFVDLMPDDSLLFDAYDQSIVELGFARAATAESQVIHEPPTQNTTSGVGSPNALLLSNEETHVPNPLYQSEGKMLCGNGGLNPLPIPSQLFQAAVLLCVHECLSKQSQRSQQKQTNQPRASFNAGVHEAFVLLKYKLSTTDSITALSQNKRREARLHQRCVAVLGGDPRDREAWRGSLSEWERSIFDGKTCPTQNLRQFLQEAFEAALSDPDHSSNVHLQHRQLLAGTDELRAFVATTISQAKRTARTLGSCSADVESKEEHGSRTTNLDDSSIDADAALSAEDIGILRAHVSMMFGVVKNAAVTTAAPQITTDTLLMRTQAMEGGPHQEKVEEKLANVIPFRFVIPVLPFFYLMLLMVFGLSWFFHPPILSTTLFGIENAIADCTNPYNTNDATEDGVIPWDCPVGFTELGMQVESFPNQNPQVTPVTTTATASSAAATMSSFFSFIKKEQIPRNVTHLPWAYLRFSTVVDYNGLKKDAVSVPDAEAAPDTSAQKYWVLTELRKLPDWAPEIFEQKNTKVNESTISFKGETTRVFVHTVIPFGFGNQTLLFVWMTAVLVLSLICMVAFVYHGHAFSKIINESEVRLVEVSVIQRSFRGVLLACEVAAILFISVGVVQMLVTFNEHKDDSLISRTTVAKWQRVEVFLRIGLIFCSFRAVSFFTEIPKPQHFAIVNAGVVGVGLVGALVCLFVLPAVRVGFAASAKSLLSIQAVDALTLPVMLGVSLFFRSSKVSDEVRQAHFEQLRDRLDDQEGTVDNVVAGSDKQREQQKPYSSNDATKPQDGNNPILESKVEDNKTGKTTAVQSPYAQSLSDSSVKQLLTTDDDDAVNVQDLSPERTSESHYQEPAIALAIHSGHLPSDQTMSDEARLSKRRAKARRHFLLNWTVVLVAGLGQVLLYALAVTVVVRPLLTLPAPGGAFPVTGDSFLSSDDLGILGVARRFI